MTHTHTRIPTSVHILLQVPPKNKTMSDVFHVNAFEHMMKRQKIRRELEQGASAKHNPLIWGVVYEWVLDRIDNPDHPLFGISYIGQVAREGLNPQQAFEARSREHVNGANREEKDLGFHCVLKEFGEHAFSRRIVEQNELPRTCAMKWANEREQHHIRERGGVLRDMEEKLEQTLNLTSGGQGDPAKRWETIQAVSARRWHEFQRQYQAYFDREGHGRVPTDHVEGNYTLGFTVRNIRMGRFLSNHSDRTEWLQKRGWVKNERDAKWMDFQRQYQAYFDREGNGRVPTDHVEGNYPLGVTIKNIRDSGHFVSNRTDRTEWLQQRGWVENELDAKWLDFQRQYQAYFDREGHGRVPKSHMEGNYPLGVTVQCIRNRGYFVSNHPDRTEWLQQRGWVENERDAKWLDFQRHYQAYFDREGHGRVPKAYKTVSGYNLGKVVTNIRSALSTVKGKRFRLQWLHDRGFVMHRTNSAQNKRKWDQAWATCPARPTPDSDSSDSDSD